VVERQFGDQPRARALETHEADSSADRLSAVLEAKQARPTGRMCATDAVIADRDAQRRRIHFHFDLDARRLRVLRGIRQCLGDDVVGSYLDLFRQAVVCSHVELDRNRRPVRERLQRGSKPTFGEDCRMDPERDLTQPVKNGREPLGDVGEVGSMLAHLLRRARLRCADLERQGDKLLLRAVVEIALDAPPRRVGGGDDPRA